MLRGPWFAVLVCVAAPLAAQQSPKRTVEFSGLVIGNGFFNSAPVNNSDVPYFVLPDTSPAAAGGATMRQTRLGVFLTEPDVLHGNFTGDLDVDFFGGQEPSAGGRTFPLLRLRRAVGTIAWSHAQVLFGQEVPLVAERNPRSRLHRHPGIAGAGNLWFWLPQLRVAAEAGYTLRLALQFAAVAPTEGRPQSDSLITRPDSAERSRRPPPRGRVAARAPPTRAGGDWPPRLARPGRRCHVQAATADAASAGPFELLAEAFTGQALAGWRGRDRSVSDARLPDSHGGGWGQLNSPTPR